MAMVVERRKQTWNSKAEIIQLDYNQLWWVESDKGWGHDWPRLLGSLHIIHQDIQEMWKVWEIKWVQIRDQIRSCRIQESRAYSDENVQEEVRRERLKLRVIGISVVNCREPEGVAQGGLKVEEDKERVGRSWKKTERKEWQRRWHHNIGKNTIQMNRNGKIWQEPVWIKAAFPFLSPLITEVTEYLKF